MSKGGSTSSDTQIPAWLENAGIENINRARDASQIGYVPYYGPDVAAFSPMQQQSMRSTGNAASAFGLAPQGFDGTAGIPQAQTFAGGIQGYSSAPMYQESLDQLEANRPAQFNAINDMFIDPFTGAPSNNNYMPTVQQVMNSNYAQGGNVGATVAAINNAPDYIPATDGGTGYWQGGDRTATQTNNLNDQEFEAYVLANGLPQNTYTTGDALRGLGGNLMDSSLFGSIYEGLTGNPLSGGSPNAPVSELSNTDAAYGGLLGADQNREYTNSLLAVQAAQAQRIAREQNDAFQAAQALKVEADAQALADRQAKYQQNLKLSAVPKALPAAVIRSGGNGSRASNVTSSGAGRNQTGSTYSGGGQAASRGYGGISGGGGR